MLRHTSQQFNTRLKKRFSQITGVPIKDFTPKNKAFDLTNKKTPAGQYEKYRHTLTTNNSAKREKTKLTHAHEFRHALQLLVNARELTVNSHKGSYPTQIKYPPNYEIKFLEPTVTHPNEKINSEIKRNIEHDPHPRGRPISVETQQRRIQLMRDLIKKHGEDGVLLLWSAPPKSLDVLDVGKWSRKMVKDGILQENGGLTKKGLKFMREHVHPQLIWQYLKAMEEKRHTDKSRSWPSQLAP